MGKASNIIPFTILSTFLSSCEKPWQPLFNGENLEGWETYIGTPLDGFEDLHANATSDKVFKVIEFDDEKLIYISGEVNGSLATIDTFSNYHLELILNGANRFIHAATAGCCTIALVNLARPLAPG